jgi:hypothetical protein
MNSTAVRPAPSRLIRRWGYVAAEIRSLNCMKFKAVSAVAIFHIRRPSGSGKSNFADPVTGAGVPRDENPDAETDRESSLREESVWRLVIFGRHCHWRERQ